MRVRWTTPAREELVAAYEYIAEDDRRAAARVVDRIWESSQLLARQPRAGKAGRVTGTRGLVIAGTPFIVAYSVEEREVRILAVLHGARKWPEEF